jgi:hypothetical protein
VDHDTRSSTRPTTRRVVAHAAQGKTINPNCNESNDGEPRGAKTDVRCSVEGAS